MSIGILSIQFRAGGSPENNFGTDSVHWTIDCADTSAPRIQTSLGFSILVPKDFKVATDWGDERLTREVILPHLSGLSSKVRVAMIWSESVSVSEIMRGRELPVPAGYPSQHHLSIYAFEYPGDYADNLYVFAVVMESEALFVMSTREVAPSELTDCIIQE